MCFEIDTHRVLHKSSKITASFPEHQKFQENMTFAEASWMNPRTSK